jgi:hypothetical protein
MPVPPSQARDLTPHIRDAEESDPCVLSKFQLTLAVGVHGDKIVAPIWNSAARLLGAGGALHKALKTIINSKFRRVTIHWLKRKQHLAAGIERLFWKGPLLWEWR